jgi:hypothetical protein
LVGFTVPASAEAQRRLGGDPANGVGMGLGFSLCGRCAGREGAAELAQAVVAEATRQAADSKRN